MAGTALVIIAALVALALIVQEAWVDAVLTVIGWGAAFIAAILLGTGWGRAAAATGAVALVAILLSIAVGDAPPRLR